MSADPIDELIWDESPKEAGTVAIIDAPGLVERARSLTDDVRVWCDDWRDAQLVDPDHRVDPEHLAGADLVWAHLPKSLAALDEIAANVQGPHEVRLLAGGRVKHMNHTMNEVLAKHFTAVNASLGRRKSRVLRAWGPKGLVSDWPKTRRHDDLNLDIAAYGATFGGTKLDPGTRLLLQNLNLDTGDVLDFGSGNGVIAAWLARRHHRVSARDVSWSAVAATLMTAAENRVTVDATWGDGLVDYADDSFDVIVANPPFHKGFAKESEDTLTMFDDAPRILRPGGQLWCVFNSHLPWRKELNERVGRTRVLAQDPRYTVTVSERN